MDPVERAMQVSYSIGCVIMLYLVCPNSALAQADGLAAYVPERPIERTADDDRITFAPSAVAGKVEALIPKDAHRVDILNARGNVKRSYVTDDLETLSLGDLRTGTWTLRVHTSTTMLVRRFVVMKQGTVVWSPSGPIRRK